MQCSRLAYYSLAFPKQLDHKLLLSAILCAAWSRKPTAGALSVLSIHSPDYVFTTLVSIFESKGHNHV